MIDLKHFISHISEEHLIAEGQRVLLAVSGGRDSVALLDMMQRAGYDIGVAHCNFHLRPGDCDRDEAFVREQAEERGVPCFVAQFDTERYAADKGLSIEEAAREQRYGFFEEVRKREGYDLVATAHHRDDAIETFFINLLRGAGIGGLHGIPSRNGSIVRPLLCYGREDINAYIAERQLTYVEDYTNAQPLYLRNRIRLQLIPLLRELSPSFDSVMESNMRHLADADIIYKAAIEEIRDRLVETTGGEVKIDINGLRQCHGSPLSQVPLELGSPVKGVLYELLRPFGFNSSVVEQVINSLDAQSGKQFFSSTHRLLKDREKLIITELTEEAEEARLSIKIEPLSAAGMPHLLPKNEACFDRDGLTFPLRLRRWRDGDRFRPFGMKGTRLVSDLFSDLKLSIADKENAWILCNGDEAETILWVVGYRASHFAIVTPATKEVVYLRV
jgi:tRNA(Ile)-lysidine synthase